MPELFPPPGTKVLRISELSRDIKRILEGSYPEVWVEGEISNLSRPSSSGHFYLTLKDDDAPIQAVVYRGVALRLRFELQDGMKVIARARLSVYLPRGGYQLQIEDLQPQGIGALELAFRQLKEKLSNAGYFLPARKKKIPRIPRRIGLVTSPTGSAVRDLLEILRRRWPSAEVWICPSRIQGDGAALEIAAAIDQMNRLPDIDVMVLGRGGGSVEDLWPFNEEVVASAIYRSRVPVVTGIGHEDDLTIADMVADLRALTPSEAAEKIVPDRREVFEWLNKLEGKFRDSLKRNLEQGRSRLDQVASRPCFRLPLDGIRQREQLIGELEERLQRSIRQQQFLLQEKLGKKVAQLEALSPLNVLARGYSLTRRQVDGQMIVDCNQVQPGDSILTRLAKGQITSKVISVGGEPDK